MVEQQLTGSNDGQPSETPGCCVASHALAEQKLAEDVRTLGAVGNETRYELLRLIASSEDGHCVCELEPALGVSQGAVSQALSRLFSAGLVERRKVGRWRYYTATPTAERLLQALDESRSHDDE